MNKVKGKRNKGHGAVASLFGVFDLFKSDVQFREGGQEGFSTVFGAIVSLIIFSLIIVYGSGKVVTMVSYEDSRH